MNAEKVICHLRLSNGCLLSLKIPLMKICEKIFTSHPFRMTNK